MFENKTEAQAREEILALVAEYAETKGRGEGVSPSFLEKRKGPLLSPARGS